MAQGAAPDFSALELGFVSGTVVQPDEPQTALSLAGTAAYEPSLQAPRFASVETSLPAGGRSCARTDLEEETIRHGK
jgi:hypothetical protein